MLNRVALARGKPWHTQKVPEERIVIITHWLFLCAVADYQVACVGYQAEYLAENKNRIQTHDSVGNDDYRACKAYYPESGREHRFMPFHRLEPLVDETECEYYLAGRAEYDQPHRYIATEEALIPSMCVVEHKHHGNQRNSQQQYAAENRQFLP